MLCKRIKLSDGLIVTFYEAQEFAVGERYDASRTVVELNPEPQQPTNSDKLHATILKTVGHFD